MHSTPTTVTPPVQFDPHREGPMAGVRVLDLSRVVAGNMLSLQLGNLGADVIKIEPEQGDPLRDWKTRGHSLYWKEYGRNKRSIALNLRHAGAQDVLWRLIDGADVLIENFRPGTLEAMGFGPDLLLARRPSLIVVRISGFGQTGPYSELPGFGSLVEGMSGFAARTGFPDREPVLPPLALADMIAGLYGALSVTTALRARDHKIANGQVIDLALLDAMYSVLGPQAAIHRLTGKVPERSGSGSTVSAPRNVYRCADGGYVALSGSTEAMARRVFQVIGRAELLDNEAFATNTARVRNRAEVDSIIGAWFAGRSRDDALAAMQAADVTVGPVYDIEAASRDPHFLQRPVIHEVEDADLDHMPMHGPVPIYSETPGVWKRPAPGIGEQSDEVLAEIGFGPEAIQALRKDGAVF